MGGARNVPPWVWRKIQTLGGKRVKANEPQIPWGTGTGGGRTNKKEGDFRVILINWEIYK